jgi:hypothetical protein
VDAALVLLPGCDLDDGFGDLSIRVTNGPAGEQVPYDVSLYQDLGIFQPPTSPLTLDGQGFAEVDIAEDGEGVIVNIAAPSGNPTLELLEDGDVIDEATGPDARVEAGQTTFEDF